jgi:hypothetical protein
MTKIKKNFGIRGTFDGIKILVEFLEPLKSSKKLWVQDPLVVELYLSVADVILVGECRGS